ncbi:MAG: RluA family pseudouridine synthase [Syntrophobacteraceae bacterium]|nr:RluA family pseudouridine synthase [Desulfobacteraceae bacterium]
MNDSYFFHPSWPVFYEDNHLLVLYKPAGLLVQGDQTGEDSLLDLGKLWLKGRYAKPGQVFLGMVHRLDRPVAGIVLFCRTSKAAGRMSSQFRSGTLRKTYLAVLEGCMTSPGGRLTQHIERRDERSSRIVPFPTASSQEARLSYRLLETGESRSLVEVELETGRHHQIRVQMASLGHPVVGDLRYGASAPMPQRQIALIARELVVEHPVRKETMHFHSPLPRDWPWPNSSEAASPPWNWKELHPLIEAHSRREDRHSPPPPAE